MAISEYVEEHLGGAGDDRDGSMRTISAPWWTFLVPSLVFITLITGTLYLGILGYHFLVG